jgi:molybdenum-dependent DNA-binding transcriptional regulator ModE
MPEWVARELGVEQFLDERPPQNVTKIGTARRTRIEQAIARTGSIAAAMRETGASYEQVHETLRWMEAA